jgi:predicted nucleic acid-binding protein
MNAYTVVKQGTKKFAVVDADNNVVKMFRVKRDAELCAELQGVMVVEAFDVAEPELVIEEAVELVVEAVEPIVELVVLDTPVIETTDAVELVVEAVEPKKLTADAKGPKKSQQVRARIAQAKEQYETQEIVVTWTIDTLGMTRQLARAYVLGNWNKV